MSIVVTDASVVLKWVLREEGQDAEKALSLFQDFSDGLLDIVLPQLWLYEVGNVLIQKTGLNEPLRILDFLLDQDFKVVEFSRPTIHRICEMARDSRVTFYDACYHALALQEGAVFVTADEHYYGKVKNRTSMLLLRDYESLSS